MHGLPAQGTVVWVIELPELVDDDEPEEPEEPEEDDASVDSTLPPQALTESTAIRPIRKGFIRGMVSNPPDRRERAPRDPA